MRLVAFLRELVAACPSGRPWRTAACLYAKMFARQSGAFLDDNRHEIMAVEQIHKTTSARAGVALRRASQGRISLLGISRMVAVARPPRALSVRSGTRASIWHGLCVLLWPEKQSQRDGKIAIDGSEKKMGPKFQRSVSNRQGSKFGNEPSVEAKVIDLYHFEPERDCLLLRKLVDALDFRSRLISHLRLSWLIGSSTIQSGNFVRVG